jgi:hypothetical protein
MFKPFSFTMRKITITKKKFLLEDEIEEVGGGGC